MIIATKTDSVQLEVWRDLSNECEVMLFSDAEAIPDAEWNSLNYENDLFTDLDYLRGMQKTAPSEMTFRYALLRKNEEIIGAFIFQVPHLDPASVAKITAPLTNQQCLVLGGLGEWITRSRKEVGVRVLISGNSFVSGKHGIMIAEGADHSIVFGALPNIVKLIVKEDVLPQEISIIIVKDYFSDDKVKPEAYLKKKNYHTFVVEPEMIVKVRPEWIFFEDYMLSMEKKYRNRAKSVATKSNQLQEANLTAKEIEEQLNDIYPLYRNLHDKADFRLSALTPAYFVEMKSRFPEKFNLITYSLHGKIVGFRSYFASNSQIEAHFIGIDYSINRELNLYLRILYDYVKDAIDSNKTELLLGRTAAEIKSTVGAVAHDLTCYIRHRNIVSNQILRPFVEFLAPSEWTPRTPFK